MQEKERKHVIITEIYWCELYIQTLLECEYYLYKGKDVLLFFYATLKRYCYIFKQNTDVNWYRRENRPRSENVLQYK